MIIEISAGGIVYKVIDGNHLWLLVQHKKARHWGFPKGHIGDHVPDEKLTDAAIREVMEEGGVVGRILNDAPISTTYFFKKDTELHKKTVHYFLMEFIAGDTSKHDDEIMDAKFVPKDEAWDLLTYNTDKEAFSEVLSLLNHAK